MADEQFDYDIIILGGGSAGIVAGVMAGGLGLRVLLIERGKMGGECLNTGCVPSKALLHAAKVAQSMRTAGEVGLQSAPVTRADAAGVFAHVRATIDAVRRADATEKLLTDNGVEIRHGDAHFLASHTLSMDGQSVTAAHFILATGSHPVTPDIPGLADVHFLSNQTFWDLDAIPERLLVVGGGPNGVETAQAMALLGSRVTLVQSGPRLLPKDDSELTAMLADFLRADGVDVRRNAKVVKVEMSGAGKTATIEANGETSIVVADEILVAVGRAPNTDGLNLEAAEVAYDDKKVQTDDALRTTAPHIYACGDLLGAHQFSHLAEYEAKKVVTSIAFPSQAKPDFRLDPWATFTDPELVHIGQTEDELKAKKIAYDVYRQPFAQNDRALTDHVARGMVKVLAAPGLSGKILGVQILGPNASELAQEWILAMTHGLGIRAVADLIHVYPTLSLASQHAAQRWYARKASEPPVKSLLSVYIHAVRPRQKAIAGGIALGAILAGLGLKRR